MKLSCKKCGTGFIEVATIPEGLTPATRIQCRRCCARPECAHMNHFRLLQTRHRGNHRYAAGPPPGFFRPLRQQEPSVKRTPTAGEMLGGN
jgi:hypothetical protein